MDRGRLGIRVTFKQLVRTPVPGGGAMESWQDFTTVWAQFSPERSRERLQAGRIDTEMGGVLRVAWSPVTAQIDGTFRVVIHGTVYAVRGTPINPDQRHDMLEMIVETVPGTDGAQG